MAALVVCFLRVRYQQEIVTLNTLTCLSVMDGEAVTLWSSCLAWLRGRVSIKREIPYKSSLIDSWDHHNITEFDTKEGEKGGKKQQRAGFVSIQKLLTCFSYSLKPESIFHFSPHWSAQQPLWSRLYLLDSSTQATLYLIWLP